MTRLPIKVRFWKRKLEKERLTLVSRTLARRVFYAGCFFYASFLAHGYFVYDNSTAPLAAEAPVAVAMTTAMAAAPPLERGVCESLLERVLGVPARGTDGRPR